MKTIEGNKLIAEFMGARIGGTGCVHWPNGNKNHIDYNKLPTKGLYYHSSWDWLMPVVEKIDGSCAFGLTWLHMKTNGTVITVYDLSNNKDIFHCYPKKNTQKATKLSITYDAIIRYIEWYNENEVPVMGSFDENGDCI